MASPFRGEAPTVESTRDVAPGLLTVGHGTATEAEFLKLVEGAGVQALVDIRSVPGSRHNPQFARQALEEWLPRAGVSYRWDSSLGGFRREKSTSAHLGLRHPAFRSYAGYMETPAFIASVDQLLEGAGRRVTAVMCAETLWWRCHRRLLADYLVLVGKVPVLHLDHRGHLSPHLTTAGVVVVGETLVYGLPPVSADPPTSYAGMDSMVRREGFEDGNPRQATEKLDRLMAHKG